MNNQKLKKSSNVRQPAVSRWIVAYKSIEKRPYFNHETTAVSFTGCPFKPDNGIITKVCPPKRKLKDEHGKTLRCSEKDVTALRAMILRYAQPGDNILDAFAGTLTTAIAALPHNMHITSVDRDQKVLHFALMRIRTYYLSIAENGYFPEANPKEVLSTREWETAALKQINARALKNQRSTQKLLDKFETGLSVRTAFPNPIGPLEPVIENYVNSRRFLAHELSLFKTYVKQSKLLGGVEFGLFSGEDRNEGEITGVFYGPIVDKTSQEYAKSEWYPLPSFPHPTPPPIHTPTTSLHAPTELKTHLPRTKSLHSHTYHT